MKTTRAILVAATLLAITPASAEAATTEQILEDWREPDGVIDGDYSLAELRRADAMINPQEREYTFWDAAYAEAVRRARRGTVPRPRTVTSKRTDDGEVDIGSIADAATRALTPRASNLKPARPFSEQRRRGTAPVRAEDDDGGGNGGMSGSGRMLGFLAIAPALVFGVGALRHRQRRTRTPENPASTDDESNDTGSTP